MLEYDDKLLKLSMLEYKDQLIKNRWSSYQNELSDSLLNPFDATYIKLQTYRHHPKIVDVWDEYQKTQREYYSYGIQHKYHRCDIMDHCCRASYEYHKLNKTNSNLKYHHFKNRKFTKQSFIKEHLWYNVKNDESIVITGNYTVEVNDNNDTIYLSKEPMSLKINNIPVSYIHLSYKNDENTMTKCKLLYFCFDLTTYCDIIDLVLYSKKLRFSYLPLEIKKYILLFTSV
jgi:hypothetical protein